MDIPGMKHDDLMSGGCAGLCLHLDAEQLKTLGLDKHPPAEGATVSLRATATVKRAAANDSAAEAEEGGAPDEQAEDGLTLELNLSGLHITQSGRAPDKVLYGGKPG